ncbi:MAG TPA: hypothetical protein VL793_02600, partial [Patescibacteria group bacterium]|nr:hypothetical protein [Patescibacteria group bacterium]
GRFALFESGASNLVSNDTNNASDVFVRDTVMDKTILVSVGSNGVPADNVSYSSAMTPDGRYVAFASAADDLVAADTNGIPDVFVRDLVSNISSLVSVGARNSSNYLANVGSSNPSITPDGRFVAFYSTTAGIVPGSSTVANIYLLDRVTGTMTSPSSGSVSALGAFAQVTNAISFNHALSDDGRFVAFEAAAVPANSPSVILRFDSQTSATELVDTNAALPIGTDYESVQNLALTPDGRFIAYVVNALDSSGETTAIRVWDGNNATSVLASGNLSGDISPFSLSDSPALSASGRFVMFLSDAPDLVSNDIPGDLHAYLRDLQAGATTLLDADTNGVGSPISVASAPVLSADGQLVAFASADGNLVPADRNRAYDVFAHNVGAGTTELVSVHDPSLFSLTPDGPSSLSASSVSADARFVAFWSEGDDLVTNDFNQIRDVFLRDTIAGTNTLISVGIDGHTANGFSSEPSISGDGRFVAFSSFADNLVGGDTNGAQDVFVRDLQIGRTVLASENAAQTGPGNNGSYAPTLCSNGQFVLFRSRATNLIPGGTPANLENLFWRDLQKGSNYALTTNGLKAFSMTPDGSRVVFTPFTSPTVFSTNELVVVDLGSKSVLLNLIAGSASESYGAVAISADGRRIASVWLSPGQKQLSVTDLTTLSNVTVAIQAPLDPDPHFSSDGRFLAYSLAAVGQPSQAYLYDSDAGTNLLISRSYDGLSAGNGNSDSIGISADGRFVCYRSAADNLVPGDLNGVPDIFLYDRMSGGTRLISLSRFTGLSADSRSLLPVFSPDGRTLLMTSWASDLGAADFNNSADVFSMALYDPAELVPFAVEAIPISGSNTACSITWPIISGRSYKVQFKTNLSELQWHDLNEPIWMVGDKAAVQDAFSVGTRFYRVVAF